MSESGLKELAVKVSAQMIKSSREKMQLCVSQEIVKKVLRCEGRGWTAVNEVGLADLFSLG